MSWCGWLFVTIAWVLGFGLWFGLTGKDGHQKQSMPPQATAGFQQSLVSMDARNVWCTQQLTTCSTVCAWNDKADDNTCSAVNFSFSCKCNNGTYPDMSAFIGGWPYLMCQETYNQCVTNVTKATPTISTNDTGNPAFDHCNSNHLCGHRNATDELLASIRYSTTEALKPHPKFTTGQIVGICFGAIIAAIIVFFVACVCLGACSQAVASFKRRRTARAVTKESRARRARTAEQTSQSGAALLATPAAAASPDGRPQRSNSTASSVPSYESYQLPGYHSTWTHSGPQDRDIP